MIFSDFHIHTTFSDGKNSPEEMVKSAIKLGIKNIGFSDHSYTFFDESYCMLKEDKQNYLKTISELKSKYSKEINIYCGIEQDFYSNEDTNEYDYVIGSVHYVKVYENYVPVDESVDDFKYAVEKYFSNDPLLFAEEYFKTVSKVIEKTNADVIGHFDLISKFNVIDLFNESDERYVNAWKNAADILLRFGKPFEINTGAISRGYKTVPYPAPEMIDYIREKGGKFILSSDAHSIDGLCFQFGKWKV